MAQHQNEKEALKCTFGDCQELQTEDGEFCEKHYPIKGGGDYAEGYTKYCFCCGARAFGEGWEGGFCDDCWEKIIKEEVEAYFAINGETGAWGESMRDEVGVDSICEMVANQGIKTTEAVSDRVRELLNTVGKN